ncbi:hypothetical protein [Sinomicrobium sp.]
MAQIKTGVVTLTNGSATAVGTNTTWLGEVESGDAFTVTGSGVFYDVASVESNTELTLSTPYSGASVTDTTYTIARDFTPLNNIVEMRKGDIETAAIFTRAMRRIDQLLSLNQDAGAITSAGIYPDTTAGLTGTTSGEYFFVPEGDEFVLYLNDSGSAVEQVKFASLASALQYATDSQAAQAAAELAQEGAETSETNAEQSATDAANSASSASDSAANALSSEQVASQQAGLANNYANAANVSATIAENAASASAVNGNVFDNTTVGIAGTDDGEYFSTPSGDSSVYLELYKNDAGVATLIATYPTKVGIESVVGVREYLTASTTYTLPSSPANGTKYVFTKLASVVPVIETTESILCAGETDTQLEYDQNIQLIMIYNSGVWEVMYE